MFPIVRVEARDTESLEPLGSKRKYWFTDDANKRMLFKAAEKRGTGTDWAEKLACELCRLIGLPHVAYELAEEADSGVPGVICENCSLEPYSLVMGNQLLLKHDPNYPVDDTSKYGVSKHTVSAVTQVVAYLQNPPQIWLGGLPETIGSALEIFIGYVLLDTWIANPDRHHQNWAALRHDDELFLCPTYDHGAAMARGITDSNRSERLNTSDGNRTVASFAAKAKSAFYAASTDRKTLTTYDAWQSFARYSPKAAETWLSQLAMIDQDIVEKLIARVPTKRMTEVSRSFTGRLLFENRKRLLEGHGHG